MSLIFALQALLVRHENSVAEAETERTRMLDSIERLELEKKGLESSNATILEENRKLLDQLEDFNDIVDQSDSRIQSLTAALQSTQHELQRLTILASRAAQFESQLTNMEADQARLESQLASKEVEARTALQRWRRADGTIGHLQDEIDKIEKEVKEERERHKLVLGRMERRMRVERELKSSAGRPEGATAIQSTHHTENRNVVSHFVRDILQDNANLQMGIVELQEMLVGSNTEVEHLREQLLLYQPLQSNPECDLSPLLSTEIQKADFPDFQTPSALHVHHHYHGTSNTTRKSRKKHAMATPRYLVSSSGTSTPRTQRIKDWRATTPSSAATILSQTTVTVPPAKRWSIHSRKTSSSFSLSSMPNSPQATSSIFDNAIDSSRPTSPDSNVAWGSPPKLGRDFYRKNAHRTVSSPAPLSIDLFTTADRFEPSHLPSVISMQDQGDSKFLQLATSGPVCVGSPTDCLHSPGHETIVEEDELDIRSTAIALQEPSSLLKLHRAASHESLLPLSVPGIHRPRTRSSQPFNGGRFIPKSTCSPIAASLDSTSAIISPATVVSLSSSQRQDSSRYTRSILAQAHGNHHHREGKHSFGKRVGGWAWNRWGVTPIPLSRTRAQNPWEAILRSPGVNQGGPVPGLRSMGPPPSQVEPEIVDRALLEESLAGA